MPARLLEPFRSKRKILYHPPDPEILKPPDHELIQNTPDNYVVTPHRKRRPGFHNSPAQNPPFVPYNPSYIEDLRSRKEPLSSSAPPSYFPGKLNSFFINIQIRQISCCCKLRPNLKESSLNPIDVDLMALALI